MKTKTCLSLTLTLLIAALPLAVRAQQESLAERVATLKATLAASKAVLKQYEWIETTTVSINGEEKSSKQERCYYGADGSLQKIQLNESPEGRSPRFGLRKRIAERKKDEMTDYMKSAVDLIKSYIPPSTDNLEAAKDAGNVSVDILDPGKRVRLNFTDYQKPGDKLSIEIDLSNNRPVAMSVSSYLTDPSDPITLNVSMGQLNEGTTYPATSILNAPSKNLEVEVINSGYLKLN